MGNQFLIMLVIGSVLGMFGSSAISKINPFKSGRVAVVKQESQQEEYFRDKVKGIEYRMTAKNKAQAPVKKTFGQSIGDMIDKFFKFILFGIVVSLFLGTNVFKYVLGLRKTLKQLVMGIHNSKKEMNGERHILTSNLAKTTDEGSKKIINDIKHEKSI